MTSDLILPSELREGIISSVDDSLRSQGSPILDSVDGHEKMLDQVRSILDEVVESCRGITESFDLHAMSRSVELGAIQAITAVHPAELLHAASAFFEIAAPHLLGAFSVAGRTEAEATVVLNRVIMRRIAWGAVSYTGFMLKAIRDSHRTEWARLARDLHDRAAHAIGVALQNLELYELRASQDLARAQEKLQRAREAMLQALNSVQHFSVELHATVGPDELEQALIGYLAANAESTALKSVKFTGGTATPPEDVCGEVYVIPRETIRNALAHSGTTRLDVTVEISESQLLAWVCDTGRGFSVEQAKKASKVIGLSSMRERVQLLGGSLRLSSRLNHGTTVEISIPLERIPL